jgi:DNA-binding CsgD family transcriptional regulator
VQQLTLVVLILALAAGLTGLFILSRIPRKETARLPGKTMTVLFLFNLLLIPAIAYGYLRLHASEVLPDRFLPLAAATLMVLLAPLKLAFVYQLLFLVLELGKVRFGDNVRTQLRRIALGFVLLVCIVAVAEYFMDPGMQVSVYLQMLLEPLVLGLAIGMAVWLWLIARRQRSQRQGEALRVFALITLMTFLAALGSFVASSGRADSRALPLFNASLLFLYNIALVTWTVRYISVVEPQAAIGNNGQSFEGLAQAYGISHREAEIVELICRGRTNSEIAESLFISLQTVKDHNYNIFRKTGVKNRVQLTNLFSRSL